MSGGGEPGHVQAGFSDDGPGQVRAEAGDLGQPHYRVQHRGARAGSGAGPCGAVGVDAPGAGHGCGQLGGPGAQLGDLGVQGGDLVQQQGGELTVVVIEHAVQGPDEGIMLGLHGAAGQGLGIALAGDHHLDYVLR